MHPKTVAVRTTRSALAGSTAIVIALAASAAAPGPARAQESQATQTVQEVVVTGSRIARRDFTAPSPIVTVTQQSFQNRSQVSLEATLNQLPQFNPAQGQFVGDQQPSATNTVGIATVNLRGLGSNRTLVLLDGRRPQPANAALVVDLNTIPAAAIDGVLWRITPECAERARRSDPGQRNARTIASPHGLLGAARVGRSGRSPMMGASHDRDIAAQAQTVTTTKRAIVHTASTGPPFITTWRQA